MLDPTDRGQFLNMAGLVEGGLVLVAFVFGWWIDVNPLATVTFSWSALAWGVLAAAPMFLLFLLAHRFPIGPLLPIKRFLIELLGPPLSACRWYDLILLAALAGLSEEMLFRGVIQRWVELRLGSTAGLAVASTVFGLAHLVTPTYAFLAAAAGVYLGLLLNMPETPNLLIPIVTHAVYDYFAFLVVVRAYRSERVIE